MDSYPLDETAARFKHEATTSSMREILMPPCGMSKSALSFPDNRVVRLPSSAVRWAPTMQMRRQFCRRCQNV